MSSRANTRRTGGRRGSDGARAQVHPLEARRMWSATPADGVWRVAGDLGANKSDVIVVEASSEDASVFRAIVNGAVVDTIAAAGLTGVEVTAGAGNDRVTVNLGSAGAALTVRVLGGDGDDRLTGSANPEHLIGGTGHDRLDGGGGNDTLAGDSGDDQLLGGDGDDTLDGGDGHDVVVGGLGRDAIAGGLGRDRLKGGDDDDDLDGGPAADTLAGGRGADALFGGKGVDRVFREAGVDALAADQANPGRSPKVDRKDQVRAEDLTTPLSRERDDPQLKQWLVDAAVKQYAWAFGQSYFPVYHYRGSDGIVVVGAPGRGSSLGVPPTAVPTPTPTATPTPTPTPTSGAPNVGNGAPPATDAGGAGGETTTGNHSGTNVQEAGVDEADLVETDGEYIYTLQDDALVIVDATPAGAMRVVSRTEIDGGALGIYLHGDRLTILTGNYYGGGIRPLPAVGGAALIDSILPYDPEPSKVTVTVLDVADRAAPRQVEETTLDGAYDGSRLIGDRLYVVLHNDAWIPAPRPIPLPGPVDPDPVDPDPVPPKDPAPGGNDAPSARLSLVPPIGGGGGPGTAYESEADYRARLEAMPLSDLLPGYESTAGGQATAGSLVVGADTYVRDLGDRIGQNLTTLALLNVGDAAGGPVDTTTVAGWGGTVYASADAMYLAASDWDGRDGPSTNLFKFTLGPDSVALAATGSVDGSVLNQFSMDEEGDQFRIATNTWGGGGDPSSSLFVLEQSGDELNVVGSVTNLAKGETLRSARFVGDRAYVVTFRQIDPLFTIDLSNPTKPRVAGELKVPGFSSYLHPISENLLIGIGRDVDPETNRDEGLQVSLFDVSNPAAAKRLDTFKLSDGSGSGGSSSSAAEYDHHAFAYFSDQQILAIPVERYDFGGGGGGIPTDGPAGLTPEVRFRQTLAVVKVDVAAGTFAKLGDVDPPSGVVRSLRIGEVLYAVGREHVRAVDLDQPGTVLGTVDTGG